MPTTYSTDQVAAAAMLLPEAARFACTLGADGRGTVSVVSGYESALASALAQGLKPLLRARAADKRRALIAAGCTVSVSGTPLPTWADAETQSALTSLVVAGGLNAALSTKWKCRDGTFRTLNLVSINALALGVMAFVDGAFSAEAAAVAAIDAGTMTTLAQVDAAGWPAST